MEKTIKDVVKDIDPANNAHWTEDGQVRLEVISKLMGKTVTREEVVAELGSFNRKNLQSGDQNEPGTLGTKSEAEGDLLLQKAEAEKRLNECNTEMDKSRKLRDQASEDLDKIITAIDARDSGATTASDIQAFQAAQAESRRLAAEGNRMLRAAIGASQHDALLSAQGSAKKNNAKK